MCNVLQRDRLTLTAPPLERFGICKEGWLMADQHGLGVSYAALSQLLGGTCVVATRLIVNQVGPLAVAGMRYLIGFFCLLPFALLFKTQIERKDWLAVFLLGALMFGFFPWAFSASTQYTTSFRAALVLSTTPLITLIANALFRFERMTIWKVLGTALAFTGVVLALGEVTVSRQPMHPWLGEVFMLSAVLGFVTHNVLARPYLQKYGSMSVTAAETAAGVFCLLGVLFVRGEMDRLLILDSTGWWSVVYLGVVGGALLYFLWNQGVKYATPALVAITVCLNPLSAMIFGAWFLEEPIQPRAVTALVAITLGIVIANRART
jgi:drug/metabolite transporter (DMT)-like permease